ncbi:MAG: MarR family winged helix-turn-helix transcriptional regulator [Christensenellales bacterium]
MDDKGALLLQNQLCFPLYLAAKEVIARYKPLLDELGLTYTQYIAMMALWEAGSLSIHALGGRLRLDSGTLTPLLKRLESKGLLRRDRSHQDERQVLVSLTAAGQALRGQALTIPGRIVRCLNLEAEEGAVLYRLLYKLLAPSACGREREDAAEERTERS